MHTQTPRSVSARIRAVLQDVIRTMYNPKFITELFRPQDVYSMASTRQIFDRLAHSSIMRLNETSMDKLFDLMTMGFKYQLLASSYPQELMHITLNHLYQLRAKIDDAPPVAALVDDVIRLVNEKYAVMPPLQFAVLKQTLCRFFSDKRVKVSLFLQDGLQKNDGAITLQYSGPLPPGVDLPGQLSAFNDAGAPLGADTFTFPLVETIDGIMPLGPPIHPARGTACTLGLNLYSKERAPPPPAAEAAAADAAEAAAAASQKVKGAGPTSVAKAVLDSVAAEKEILAQAHKSTAKTDLNMLADLMGMGADSASGDGSGLDYKLNLFPDTSMSGKASGGGGGGSVPVTQTIILDGDIRGTNQSLRSIMDDLKIGGDSGAAPADDDDLLSMMDSAGKD